MTTLPPSFTHLEKMTRSWLRTIAGATRAVAAALLFGLCLLALADTALGQSRSWAGAAPLNSDWSSSLNWAPIGVPTANESVRIGDLPGQGGAFVVLDVNAVIDQMDLFESSQLVMSADLDVTGSVQINDSSEISVGFLNPGAYELKANKLILADAGKLTSSPSAVIELEERLRIDSGAELLLLGSTVNILNLQNSAQQVLDNNGTIVAAAPATTTTIDASGLGTLDLDGKSEAGRLEVNPNSVLDIRSSLADDFNGEILIIGGGRLNTANAWTAGAGAQIELNGGEISGGTFLSSSADILVTSNVNATSRISTNAVINGGSIQVGSATALQFDENVLISGGTKVESRAFLFFKNVSLDGVDVTGTGIVGINGILDIFGDVTLEGTSINWDGTGGSPASRATNIASGAALRINFSHFDTSDDGYGGTLLMNGGDLSVNTDSDEWRMSGAANLAGNNSFTGDRMIIDAPFNVSSGAQSIEAHVDFGPSAAVNLFNDSTAVATENQARFLAESEVTVGAGTRLDLNGTTVWDGPASVTGGGRISQNGPSQVSANTTITVDTYDWDGANESSTTTIDAGASLTIDAEQIDSDNRFDGTAIANGNLNVTTASPWQMNGMLQMHNSATSGSPVTFSGRLEADGDQANGIQSDTTFVAGSEVVLATGARLLLSGDTNDLQGGSLSGDGTLFISNQTEIGDGVAMTINHLHLLNISETPSHLEMNGGDVRVTNFTKDGTATFGFNDGVFAVDGGDGVFNSSFSFGGPSSNEQPFFRVDNGADVAVAFGWRVANGDGQFATTIVQGTDGNRRSTLRGTGGGAGADIVVGDGPNSDGTLLVNSGGLVDLRDDFIIGRSDGSHGEATVIGVERGVRSTVDVTGGGGASIQAGGGDGTGVLRIQSGGLVQTSSDLTMARFAGAESNVIVENAAQGFPAELDVAESIYVGGTANAPGGSATMFINDGGLVRAREMIVWHLGKVEMSGGDLHLDRIDLSAVDSVFNLTGGTVHVDDLIGDIINDGGTIAPGDSPGVTVITGNYKHGPDARLLIELGGVKPATQYDVLEVTGEASLNGGTLETLLIGGFVPSLGDQFAVLTTGNGLQGRFASELLPSLGGDFDWTVAYGKQDVVLEVISALNGDTNNDGMINVDDLNNVRNNFGQMGADDGSLPGDAIPFDGLVNIDDLNNVRNNFGTVATAAVPEPSTWLQMMWALAALASPLRTVRSQHRDRCCRNT